jgi:hypothetical protein
MRTAVLYMSLVIGYPRGAGVRTHPPGISIHSGMGMGGWRRGNAEFFIPDDSGRSIQKRLRELPRWRGKLDKRAPARLPLQ